MSTSAMARLRERLLTLLAKRRFPFVAAALGVLLALPSLGAGLQTEDILHQQRVAAHPGLSAQCFDLFGFVDDQLNKAGEGRDLGVLPWWTSDDLKISFFRPLSSAWHCFDYSFFPNAPWLMHMESLLLFGLLVVLLGRLYRSLLSTAAAAGLATLLYAIDDAHGPALGWIANRNAILSTIFGVLAVGLYARGRRRGALRDVVLAPLALLASLLSAEAGVATACYLLAHAAFLDRASWRRRALALAPHLAVIVGWRAVWVALGYGTRASALYVDPLSAPSRFIEAAAQRLPILLFSQLGHRASDDFVLVPARRAVWLVIFAVAALAVAFAILLPFLFRSASARFFALGSLLSALACCAAPPSDRLLFFVGIGAMGLIAELLVALVTSAASIPEGPARWPLRALGVAFVGVHLLYAPLRLPARSVEVARAGDAIRRDAAAIFSDVAPRQAVIIVRGAKMFDCTFAVSLGYRLREAQESVGLCLSAGPSALFVRRVDDRTLLLRPAGGFFDNGLNRLQWDARHPLAPGDRIKTAAFDVRIVEVNDEGEPVAAELEFRDRLEHAAAHWIAWEQGKYVPFELPAVGEERTIAGAASRR